VRNGALWTASTQKIVKDFGSTELRIKGQGSTLTKIGYSSLAGAQIMWKFVGAGLKEFSGMTLYGDGYSASSGREAFSIALAENCLVNDIKTDNFAGPTAILCGTVNSVVSNSVFSNVLYAGTYQFYLYGRCANWPANWTSNWGTINYDVFFEDNIFGYAHHPISEFAGATAVVRYNTFHGAHSTDSNGRDYTDYMDAHEPTYGFCPSANRGSGVDSNAIYCVSPPHALTAADGAVERGGRAYEVYNNNFICDNPTCTRNLRTRSGSTLFYNNSSSGYQYQLEFIVDSHSKGGHCDTESDVSVQIDNEMSTVKWDDWPTKAKSFLSCGSIGECVSVGVPWDCCQGNGIGTCVSNDGCCDPPQKVYVWGNSTNSLCIANKVPWDCCTGAGTGTCSPTFINSTPKGLLENSTYFLSSPAGWTPYRCPHPLTGLTGTCNPNIQGIAGYNVVHSGDTTPPAAPSGVNVS
jgi:hypothetical protein